MKTIELNDGDVCIDIYEPLTAGMLRNLRAAEWTDAEGGKHRIAAIGRTLETLAADLTEAPRIVQAGFGLFTYGEARTDSMTAPSAHAGIRDAVVQLAMLQHVGLPTDMMHALDVEQIDQAHPFPSGGAVSAYVNGWWKRAVQYHDPDSLPVYHGWGIPDEVNLFEDWLVTGYWASSPKSKPVPVRGNRLVQVAENVALAGITVDVDVFHADSKGGQWRVAVAD